MAQGFADNDDKIAHFQAVTGLQDSNLCAQILQNFNWDLDLAVGYIADGNMDEHGLFAATDSSDQSLSSAGPSSSHIDSVGDVDSEQTPLIPSARNHVIVPQQAGPGLIWRVATLPFSVIRGSYNVMYGAVGLGMWIAGSVLSHSLGALGLGVQQHVNHRGEGANPLLPTSVGAGEAFNFVRSFEREYGTFHPAFETMSFMDALRRAKLQYKFLFVYLHSPDHENTPLFVEQTLCSELVVQFLNEHFIIWGGNIRSTEGYKMSNSLKASTFPFCAVVIASSNQQVSLLQQLEGQKSAADLISALQRLLDEQGASLVAARIEEEEREMNRRLRDEQDAAYQASLQADQERERQRREEEQRLAAEKAEAERKQREEEEAARRAAQKAAEKQKALEKRRQQKILALGPEPEKGPDVTEVLIRFPNGERKGRRFFCNSTLASIYDYVDSLPDFNAGNYKLVSNFPRIVYTSDKLGMTLKDAGLHPRASLYIQIEED
ncbi:hypothetical protein KP509_01G095600 [Ceratopteris richardii]|uniref:UBX domain-containing protein n=1 Tax=Ceratopteris richardii TaxID=49495 RepID=A0A8T2VFD2_CERRI|nr:hypothetical protein KP509_01G095600 [Ceratopteris richardii]KAH7447187.1 hypothetical protein KP509_01G095600 [Ceratopteris richardii]